MAKYFSPSDYTSIAPNYSNGEGYYTNVDLVTDLLQIPALSGSTNPTEAQVGQYIKRTEDYIDNKTGISHRPITYIDEYHDFSFRGGTHPRYWSDYVGFVQLNNVHIQKILKLEVWQGSSWTELASATASITVASDNTNRGVTSTITLTLPDSTAIVLDTGTTASTFNNTLAPKTTVQEIVYLINGVFPTNTATITGATAAKSDSQSPQKYFYATIDSENQNIIVITSLLMGEDGSECTIAVTGTGLSKTDFTDKEDMARLGNWWKIDREGRIFFRTKFPYLHRNSIKTTYIAGNPRVPGIISDAATKLVACEILRHDDQTILIADTGASIDVKTKYDLLKKEAEDLINLGKETVFLLD
tara:strand:- start:112 stop:1188 length:1077 start_codon:yes stop_codon:yes gene_type:complete